MHGPPSRRLDLVWGSEFEASFNFNGTGQVQSLGNVNQIAGP